MLDKVDGNRGRQVCRRCVPSIHVTLKPLLVTLFTELVGAGGFLQGEQGELMTPGFPEKNYSNSVLYQVLGHTFFYMG